MQSIWRGEKKTSEENENGVKQEMSLSEKTMKWLFGFVEV